MTARSRATAFVLLLLALAACNQAGPAQKAGGKAPAANVVEVFASEFLFKMEDRVKGGVVSFQMKNVGGLPHEFAFGRVPAGLTEKQVVDAIVKQKDIKGFKDLAGVPALSPGRSVTMTRRLTPGNYFFICFFPSAEGKPHVFLGMHKLFTVSGNAGAKLPDPDIAITATDKGIQVPAVRAGRHVVELRNDGTGTHEFLLVAFAPGKDLSDVDKWFGSGFKGPVPVELVGGIQSIPKGTSVFETIEFESGKTYTLFDMENELEETFRVT